MESLVCVLVSEVLASAEDYCYNILTKLRRVMQSILFKMFCY